MERQSPRTKAAKKWAEVLSRSGHCTIWSGPITRLQVHASRSHIDKIQRSGSTMVDMVRQSSDERENIRRINEEERRRVSESFVGSYCVG